MSLTKFIENNYRHFNARELKDATAAYKVHLQNSGKVLVSLAGAMSTAEIGITLSEMIRNNKVHAISCTGANLEEDLFSMVVADQHPILPDYRSYGPQQDSSLQKDGYCRVTDTLISTQIISDVSTSFFTAWDELSAIGEPFFPQDILYKLYHNNQLLKNTSKLKDSWVLAAFEKNIPIFVPGWEDSTLGNLFCSAIYSERIKNPQLLKYGHEYMLKLIEWYRENESAHPMGFFQIGGGIAGDFAICVVPSILYNLRKSVSKWSYFCQISDSTTSFGSYSGAPPTEKITWGKLDTKTKMFYIESDASIVAPLIFNSVLEN